MVCFLINGERGLSNLSCVALHILRGFYHLQCFLCLFQSTLEQFALQYRTLQPPHNINSFLNASSFLQAGFSQLYKCAEIPRGTEYGFVVDELLETFDGAVGGLTRDDGGLVAAVWDDKELPALAVRRDGNEPLVCDNEGVSSDICDGDLPLCAIPDENELTAVPCDDKIASEDNELLVVDVPLSAWCWSAPGWTLSVGAALLCREGWWNDAFESPRGFGLIPIGACGAIASKS